MMKYLLSIHMPREDDHHNINQNDDCDDKHNDNGAQKNDTNVDDPTLLPSVGSKWAHQAPPNPPPHNLPPSFPTQKQLMVLFCCPTS